MLSDFLKLLAGKKPDGVVWTGDLSYWISGQKEKGLADPAWDTEKGYLELHRQCGVMPYYYYPQFFIGEAGYEAPVRERRETPTPHFQRHIFETPLGDLVEESAYLPDSACWGVTRHRVQTVEDLERMLFVLRHRRWVPCNLADYPARRAIWESFDGLPCLGLPRSPLAAFLYEWAGVEQAVYLMADHEGLVREALDLMEQQEAPLLDALCAAAPPLIHFPDNLSSENVAGWYDDWMAPTHRHRLARLHRAGIRAAVHLDGTVRGLLPKLVAVGFDAVEALTPLPAGDLEVEEIARLAGSSSTILWGGLPGVLFAPPYTWSDMQKHLDRLLKAWAGRPFIVGVADQIPPDGRIDFCRQIADYCAARISAPSCRPQGNFICGDFLSRP